MPCSYMGHGSASDNNANARCYRQKGTVATFCRIQYGESLLGPVQSHPNLTGYKLASMPNTEKVGP